MQRLRNYLCLCALTSTWGSNNSITFGNVRITVHTPALLRLEWSDNKSFDDRPTLAFTNRSVGPPPFSATTNADTLQLNTSLVALIYSGNSSFSGDNLRISFSLTPGSRSVWTPDGPGTVPCGTVAGQDRQDCGVVDPNATSCEAAGCCFDPNVNGTNYDQHVTHCCACISNSTCYCAEHVSTPKCPKLLHADRPTVGGTANLLGSVSSMDCDLGVDACIAWYRTQLNQGLVSRDGWVLVDDSGNPALQSSNFSGGSVPWRIERPWSAGYQDWYFFGHGHDYKQAVADFAAVSGPISMLDVQARSTCYRLPACSMSPLHLPASSFTCAGIRSVAQPLPRLQCRAIHGGGRRGNCTHDRWDRCSAPGRCNPLCAHARSWTATRSWGSH